MKFLISSILLFWAMVIVACTVITGDHNQIEKDHGIILESDNVKSDVD